MRFETYVAFRYLRGRRKSRFISLITFISITGVSVGVIALIVVMSVMTGFDNALRATIVGNRSHLVVAEFSQQPIVNPEALIREIAAVAPEIEGGAPISQFEAFFRVRHGSKASYAGGFIQGIDPEQEQHVTQLADNLTRCNGRRMGGGKLPGDGEIVLGYRLAQNLMVGVGGEVQVFTPRQVVSPFGMAPARDFWLTVSGISEAQMYDFDTYYAFVNLNTAALLKGETGVDAVHFKLADPFLAQIVADRIERELGLDATTWYESQEAFFGALKQEKFVMGIILVFIILVAAFNITSTLIMVVMEKRQDIGILRTIGVSGNGILRIFIIEGLLIGITGTVVGVALGTLLAYNLNPVAAWVAGLFGIDLFNTTIYYFDRIPVDVVPFDVLWITLSAVVLTFISTLYPAWSAARLDPVEAIRYE